VLSRRGFLASSAAAVAAPVILATDIDRAYAQTMESTTAASRLLADWGHEVVAALNSDNGRLVPMYKDVRQNPDGGFMEVRPSGSIAHQPSELGFQVKIGIRKTGVVGTLLKRCRTVGHLPPRYMDPMRFRRQPVSPILARSVSRGDDGAEAPVAKPVLNGDEL